MYKEVVMKKISFVFLFLLLTQVSVYAEQRNPQVPRISASTAYKKFMNGDAILIDANPASTYQKTHILGSINMPNDGPEDIEKFRSMPLSFALTDEIIVYCM